MVRFRPKYLKDYFWQSKLRVLMAWIIEIIIVVAVAFGVVMFALTSAKFPDKPMGALAATLIGTVLVFVACFGLLTLSARAYRKRQAQLEEEPADADELDGRNA